MGDVAQGMGRRGRGMLGQRQGGWRIGGILGKGG